MRDCFLIPKKLFTIDRACVERERLRNIGKKVVLTNGCFDLLHVGHVSSLESARALGDSLWTALNSDKSTKKRKKGNSCFRQTRLRNENYRKNY